MIFDKQNLFDDQRSLNLAAATYVTTNSVDLGVAAIDTLGNTVLSDVGRSRFADILVQITSTVTSGGAPTIQFNIITATDVALTAGIVVYTSSAPIAFASLLQGYEFRVTPSAGFAPTGRYLGLQFIIATAACTGGAFTAMMLKDINTNQYLL